MGSTLTHGDAGVPNESNAELAIPTLAELVDVIAELHPLPAVATSILQLTEHDRFSAHELASAITAARQRSTRVDSASVSSSTIIGVIQNAAVSRNKNGPSRSTGTAQCLARLGR